MGDKCGPGGGSSHVRLTMTFPGWSIGQQPSKDLVDGVPGPSQPEEALPSWHADLADLSGDEDDMDSQGDHYVRHAADCPSDTNVQSPHGMHMALTGTMSGGSNAHPAHSGEALGSVREGCANKRARGSVEGEGPGAGAGSTTSFHDLPEEVLLLILKSLAVRDVISISRTCRGLNQVGRHDALWEPVALSLAQGNGPILALPAPPAPGPPPMPASSREAAAQAGITPTRRTATTPGSPAAVLASSRLEAAPAPPTTHAPHPGTAGAPRAAAPPAPSPLSSCRGEEPLLPSNVGTPPLRPVPLPLRSAVSMGGVIVVRPRPPPLLQVLAAAFLAQGGARGVSERAGLHRLVCKALTQCEAVASRFPMGLRQGHDRLRLTLSQMWSDPGDTPPDARRWLLQLTRYNWSLAYEALGVAFAWQADCVALRLRDQLEKQRHASMLDPQGEGGTPDRGLALWRAVLGEWGRFRAWLTSVAGMCNRLVEKVSAARAADTVMRERSGTPSLRELGIIAFRSQVVLAYSIRIELQTWLLEEGLRTAPAGAADVLPDVRRFLTEVDVQDDDASARAAHTQSKLRRCFGLEPGAGALSLRGRLRVPPL